MVFKLRSTAKKGSQEPRQFSLNELAVPRGAQQQHFYITASTLTSYEDLRNLRGVVKSPAMNQETLYVND